MTKFWSNITLEGANDIQFKNTAGANTGKIESDGNDLVLSNAVGDILLGDGASDVYIGDGTNNVDILFEQSGSIKAEDGSSGVTLTLGSSDTTLALESSISSELIVGVDDTGYDVTFFGATSGKKMLWDQSADTLIVDGTLDINGNASILTGGTSGTLTVGRNGNENMVIYVDDSNTTITGVQDSDTNAAHNFILNRTFAGSGANNFIIQKGGTAQLTLDTSGNATILGNLTLGDGADKTITGPLNNDLILNARPNGADEGVKIQIGGTDKLSVLQDGGTTFAGTLTVGVDDTGHDVIFYGASSGQKMQWDESADQLIIDGRLDMNGSVDISGDLVVNGDNVTFQSANADDPIVTIKNTSNDTNDMAQLKFVKDRGAAPAAGTNLAEIYFVGEDSAQNEQEYGRILCEIDVATGGQESGILKLGVANHDGGNGYGLSMTGGSANDEVDVTVALGAASVTTVSGTLTMGSTATLTNAGLLAVENQSNITGLGTISSGVWRGTRIATAYQFQRQIFDFKGYGTHDGTNYEIPQAMTDTNAPFEHNTSVGSAGTTAVAVSLLLRAGGHVMPYAGTIKKWTGWAAGSGSGAINLALFRYRPNAGSSSAQSLVLIDNQALTAAGAQTVAAIEQTSFTDGDIAAGDIIMTGIKGVSGKTTYFTSTMEIEWD